MNFSHYSCEPVEMAAALVNTDQRAAGKGDWLRDVEHLRAFLEPFAPMWEGETQRLTTGDLDRVKRQRDRLRAVFAATDTERAVADINTLLAEYHATPRVSTHGGEPHLHFEPRGSAVHEWLGVVTAMGLATVMVENGLDRFGVCAADDCADVFVDTSRNRSRRHCSTTCSTRGHVAAHRRRQRQSG